MNCGPNQEFAVRAECPLTCLNQKPYDCGEVNIEEGCFCKPGFVMGTNNDCILPDQCACTMADNTTTLQVT